VTSAADRLQLLYEVSRRLTTFTDLPELLRYATRRTQELFAAEGCAILLHDRATDELYFLPVASQDAARREVETRLPKIRFPADRGVAGWVLAHGEATLVEDAHNDPRFYSGIDRMTEMNTRSLLCAPLRVGGSVVGVVSVVNPSPDALNREDLAFLEALASDIAVAHEKVLLYQRLQGEVIGLRQAARAGGLALLVLGILFVVGAVIRHLAWAAPLRELPARPGLWLGLVLGGTGAVLLSVGRGRLLRPAGSSA
jgi:GAF domain-containing protein